MQASALNKCGIVSVRDYVLDMLKYSGLEYIVIQTAEDSNFMRRFTSRNRGKIELELRWESVNGTTYLIIHRQQSTSYAEQGYYIGNNVESLRKHHSVFVQ